MGRRGKKRGYVLCLHISDCYYYCGENTSVTLDHFLKFKFLGSFCRQRETVDKDADKEKYDFANVRPMYYFDLGKV